MVVSVSVTYSRERGVAVGEEAIEAGLDPG